LRNIRGVKALVEYLKEIDVPIGETTIYKLVREKQIPHNRISNRVLIFNLDAIDQWLMKEVS
jgi:predicted DNA-binding transcriptional regulator AlpA